MSNKPKKLKAKNETQIGNFIVSRYGEDLKIIKVRSVAGNWAIQWRSDSEFYHLVEDMLKQEGQIYFQNFIAVAYIASNGVKDNQFFNDFAIIWEDQNNRFNEVNVPLTEEEDQKIINEEREKYNDAHNTDKI